MKKGIFLAIMCALFSIAHAQENKVSVPGNETIEAEADVTVVFDKSEYDFGSVSESGGIVECEFVFKNTGDTPLVVSKVTTSCGCTAPDWSKEPVATGKQGFIKVTFNPKGRKGSISKSLTVFTNGNPSSIRLKVKGIVE
ncbi:MAG: DUF1573 domain-containing protein [Tannerella sp.]|jgi:hypothetical protein|nr:DUF1573 domain-containing protein [Tannerella sp.]